MTQTSMTERLQALLSLHVQCLQTHLEKNDLPILLTLVFLEERLLTTSYPSSGPYNFDMIY